MNCHALASICHNPEHSVIIPIQGHIIGNNSMLVIIIEAEKVHSIKSYLRGAQEYNTMLLARIYVYRTHTDMALVEKT
jgi:hypothetical protein